MRSLRQPVANLRADEILAGDAFELTGRKVAAMNAT